MISWFRRRGQVASFMIAVIVILLIGLMVTVNLGKVAMNKTHASNAADAGALAGSSGYNSTLNNLAYQNFLMITAYLTEQIGFLFPVTICKEPWRYAGYIFYSAAAATDYYLAWKAGKEGYIAARNSARQLALVNSGIDQPKASRETGESYNDWLIKKSPFEEYMENQDYEQDDSSTIYYNWTDRVKYGQTGTSGGENSVKVEVNGPDFPGLYPMSMPLVGIYYDGPFPPFTPCKACSLACFLALTKYANCLLFVKAAFWFTNPLSSQYSGTHCQPCGNAVIWDSPAGVSYGGAIFLPSFATCGMPVWNIGTYIVLIAYIADIVEDDPEIEVTVTKKEPQINLGLWKMNYDDPKQTGQGGITSSAKAKTSGGSVGPSPKQSYDSHLIEVSK